MPKVTQLVLNLQSKPGVLANVAGVLGRAGVNIEGMCGVETAGRGKIRLLVSDAARAEAALKAAKIRSSREDAITISLENRPGALAEAAGKLARAKVNIKCAYSAMGPAPGPALVVLTVSNLQKGLAALGG
ncbi:MAG TPA: amino acid-binding protein [Candidatus Methylomirabilis sp.]|nr:amino acid-binding protein [Candidatus Methylomirabilis sp.]